jgi:hypothetical protein
MTIKKIISSAWEVTILLYNWKFPPRRPFPGADNSNLIITLAAVPAKPLSSANIR